METKGKNIKKTFDTVKFVREQRDKISKDIMNLTPQEIVDYFEKKGRNKKHVNPSSG